MTPETALDDPLLSSYPAWRFMLEIDEVNYNLDELVALAARGDGPAPINISSGVNFTATPAPVVEFILRAATHPLFWHDYDGPYGHVAGRAAVAVAETWRSGGRVRFGVDDVIVTAGASAAVALAARTLNFPGPSSAVVPVPTFPLVAAALAAAGMRLVEVPTALPGRWLPATAELIDAAPTDARVVYVNTFNNPSGEHYDTDDLRVLVEWARERNIVVLHDTVSSGVAAGAEPLPHLPTIAAKVGYPQGLITIGSLSKTRSLPGFRVGWLLGSSARVRRMGQGNEIVAPSSLGVAAPALLMDLAATAVGLAPDDPAERSAAVRRAFADLQEVLAPYSMVLPELSDFLEGACEEIGTSGLVEELARWQRRLRRTLADNAALLSADYRDLVADVLPWRGDFNTFVRVPDLAGHDHLVTSHRLLREHRLQTLPAPAFGLEERWWAARGYHLRLSFALPNQQWRLGLDRLRTAVQALTRS